MSATRALVETGKPPGGVALFDAPAIYQDTVPVEQDRTPEERPKPPPASSRNPKVRGPTKTQVETVDET
jgi:hypothetical protein